MAEWLWHRGPTHALWFGPVVGAYGTQLLAPFSNRRFALDALAIVDPAYSLVLALGLGAAGADLARDARIELEEGMREQAR